MRISSAGQSLGSAAGCKRQVNASYRQASSGLVPISVRSVREGSCRSGITYSQHHVSLDPSYACAVAGGTVLEGVSAEAGRRATALNLGYLKLKLDPDKLLKEAVERAHGPAPAGGRRAYRGLPCFVSL
ncbi:hypothetical protein EVAR_87374_1 [Eumeta japonica]|uniref:Uncharacterized protein n=1 Tax=Eumeta variegata TaxID=151549 RepID=A0A4C1Y3W5_EUMVA|nr:hypothetical protein EVAR_87374_1 [Eumeta japonica]